jgi:hypothetical protein
MSLERGKEPVEAPFWDLDEALGALELRERPGGQDRYTVRLKAHTNSGPYHAARELYPLLQDGTQHEVSGTAYILVPDLTLTVGLYPEERAGGPIGEVTDAAWQGMRHHEIAHVRGLYYEQDQALAVWEVDDFGRLDEFTHDRLWLLVQQWLVRRFPETTRLYTDDAEPRADQDRNRAFLRDLGYAHVSGTHRIFAKEVIRRP